MTPSTDVQSAIDDLLPAISQAVADWKAKNTPDVLKTRITKELDKNAQEIMFKLLGFNNNWGKWELDHCNGRSGESAAGDYLKKTQSAAIRSWLENIELPDISAALKKQYQAEFKNTYYQQLRSRVQAAATSQANKDIDTLVSRLVTSNQISKYLSTLKLLDPTFIPGNSDAS